jgi:dienelactone hydrolase
MSLSWGSRVLLGIAMLTAVVAVHIQGSVPTVSSTNGQVTWRPTIPPENGDVDGAEWLEIDVPIASSQDRRILAAVFRPAGEGPFPVVVYLHGASGLSTGMVRWAPRLSKAGFLVVAGCYAQALQADNRIACRNAPTSDSSVAALLDVATELPDARRDGLAVLGLSHGARMAFTIVGDTRVRAVVADSGDPGVVPLVDPSGIAVAILLLTFDGDGSVNLPALRRYDQKLGDLGKPIESRYFDGVGHVVTLDPRTTEEATALTIDFFRRQLGEASDSQP